MLQDRRSVIVLGYRNFVQQSYIACVKYNTIFVSQQELVKIKDIV